MATAQASQNSDAQEALAALHPSLKTAALHSHEVELTGDPVFSHRDIAIYTISKMSEIHYRVSRTRTETYQDWARFERLRAVRAAIPANAFPEQYVPVARTDS
jgi:putative SOS response-associated peptidase YedK